MQKLKSNVEVFMTNNKNTRLRKQIKQMEEAENKLNADKIDVYKMKIKKLQEQNKKLKRQKKYNLKKQNKQYDELLKSGAKKLIKAKPKPRPSLYQVDITVQYQDVWIRQDKTEFRPSTLSIRNFPLQIEGISKNDVENKAETIANDILDGEHNDYHYTEDREIISINMIKIDDVKRNADYDVKKEFMTAAKPIKFEWIKNIEFNNDGMCGYNALGHQKRAPKIFKQPMKLLKKFQSYEDQLANLDNKEPIKLTLKMGIKPEYLQILSQEYDITHYCLDYDEKILLKNISKSRNYDIICYIAHSGHMYLITDKDFINKLSQSRNNNNIIVGMLRNDNIKEDNSIQAPILENVEIDDLDKLHDCTVIFGNVDLREMYLKLVALNPDQTTIYNHKSTNDKKIKTIYYKNNVVLMSDPNVNPRFQDMNNPEKKFTWKDVKQLCELKDIPFTNQSIAVFITQLSEKILHPDRIYIKKEKKLEIIKNQENKCNICKCSLSNVKYQFDHIIPRCNEGSDDVSNLQALCIECHFEKTMEEKENNKFFHINNYNSTFNNECKKIVKSDAFKRFTFIERFNNSENKQLYTIDCNKTRRNILRYMKDLNNNNSIPVFTVFDEPSEFNKIDKIKPGFYFIESNNYLPLRNNGWYSYSTVIYCLKNKLITLDNIKVKWYSSLVLENGYFNKVIDELIKLPGHLSKFGPNALIGCFNINEVKHMKTFFTTNYRQACTEFMKNKANTAFIQQLNGTNVYEVQTHEEFEKQLYDCVLYNVILELEAIEMHKLKSIIESNGGVCTFINTDCCEFYMKNKKINKNEPIDINEYFWDNNKTVPKYKYEIKVQQPKYMERMKNFKCNDKFTLPQKCNWNVFEDPKHDNFDLLATLFLIKNKSCLLNGFAGSGKTTLIRKIQDILTRKGKKFITLAPTNKAARQISENAITIHKFLIKAFANTKTLYKKIKDLDYIIVDEISMVQELFYQIFISIKNLKPSIRFILCGDFKQIPPVNDRANFNYETSKILHEICDGNRFELLKCRRSEKEIRKLSKDIENIDLSKINTKECERSICFTNDKRIEINNYWMKYYYDIEMKKKLNDRKYMIIPKLNFDGNSQNMFLVENMPLIAKVTKRKLNIDNADTFTILKINSDSIIIKKNNEEIEINKSDINKLFYPAFCITTCKAQGSTFDWPTTIYEWSRFSTKYKYTALTRLTKLKYLNICV